MSQQSDQFYQHAGGLVRIYKWKVYSKIILRAGVLFFLALEAVTYVFSHH